MQTMTIEYNPTDRLVQSVIELIQQVKNIRIVSRTDEFEPNEETLAAMKEARTGNLKTYTNVDEMFKDILG